MSVSTLILYDTTGEWGWLGEIYGIMTANLASHFGTWTAQPVAQYQSGQMSQYTAVIYVGSTYGEPIPAAFLADAQTYQSTPIIWIYDNIWQLTAAAPGFQANYGWMWSGFDTSTVAQVNYKGQALSRYSANAAGIMNYVLNTTGTVPTVLATAVRSDGSTFPWALRSRNLTYIGENPLVYITEGDRYLAFCDFLFDALAPSTPTQHRALVRLEDIDPSDDPTPLKAIADYLFGQGVPFGFQIIPRYTDPTGLYNGGVSETIVLSQKSGSGYAPQLITAIKYMQSKGGVMIGHGWTHQYTQTGQVSTDNPYTGVSGDDAEFYRETSNADLSINYVGPVAEDSTTWVTGRLTSMAAEYTKAGLAPPALWTSPNYVSSATASKLFASKFVRTERPLYFKGLLSGGTPDPTRMAGQYFPYSVVDVYGGKVLADTLGGIEPLPFGPNPARLVPAILADAQRNLVVRDGFASFFYHPSDSITYLQEAVAGIKALGYTFISFNAA